MLGLRVMFWNLGVILWGWGLVNSCLGVWPNSRICVSMAILWSVSSMLPSETEGKVSRDAMEIFRKAILHGPSCSPVTVDATFVGQRVKHWKTVREILVAVHSVRLMLKFDGVCFTIMSCHSLTASLFEAKHQVNPFMKVLWYILTLQCRLVFLKKIAGILGNGKDKSLLAKGTIYTSLHNCEYDTRQRKGRSREKLTWGPGWENNITN